MRRSSYSIDDVANINGWTIQRERIGAATYWHARVWDDEGYGIAGSDFPTRRAAEAFARVTPHPVRAEPTAELLAVRAANRAIVARMRGAA